MRRVTIVVDSRANWSRAATVLEAIDKHPNLEARFVVCSSFVFNYSFFTPRQPDSILDTYEASGDSPLQMVKSSASLLNEFSNELEQNTPDVVIAMTDRYETLAIAQAAALMNISVAHIQGGEVTGTIDESIRHAVTKLSHIHFVATDEAAKRVIRLGEDPEYVYNVGCPATDLLLRVDVSERPKWFGAPLEPYILLLHHPVTTEYGHAKVEVQTIVSSIRKATDLNILAIRPNLDAGFLGALAALRDNQIEPFEASHSYFIQLMAHAEVLAGNSSAGIRESCYFGVPTIDVGTRQLNRRPVGRNVITGVAPSRVGEVLKHVSFPDRQSEYLYGNGDAGKQIAHLLATIDLPNIQKRFVVE